MLIIQLFDTSTLDCQLTCEPIELQGEPSTSKAEGIIKDACALITWRMNFMACEYLEY